ncbi:MAG: hypothetical protein LUG99_03600 [Lachnospiraceae bacterium]|nr:hypothetical protein [Lachnospiraceae bacterium]
MKKIQTTLIAIAFLMLAQMACPIWTLAAESTETAATEAASAETSAAEAASTDASETEASAIESETETEEVVLRGLVKTKKGKYRFYKKDGTMLTSSWKTINGYRYYFKANGNAAVGGYKIGNYIYVFKANGRLAKKSSAGRVTVNGDTYYVDKKGRATTSSWLIINNKLCYAAKNGKLKKNTTFKNITFNSNGYAESGTEANLKLLTMKIVSQITTDGMTQAQKLRACWSYVTNRSRWYYYGSYPSNFASGWQKAMAYRFLSGGGGNCYAFACAFAALACEVGYDAYVVCGRVSGSRDGASDGLTRHAWVRINGCYYDPEAQFAGWWTGCYGVGSYGIRHTISAIYRFSTY